MKINKDRIGMLFHWDTSLQYGSDVVKYEDIVKGNIKESVGLYEKEIQLSERLVEKYSSRKTERNFDINGNCTMDDLSYIVSNSIKMNFEEDRIRAVSPSAGAMYPFRYFILVNKLDQINKGIYEYNAVNNSLGLVKKVDDFTKWSQICLNQKFTEDAKFTMAFVLVVDYEKIACKYGSRGYRYALLEAGHIVQNMQLAAKDVDIKSVPVGGFLDYFINKELELDLNEYLPVYCIYMGR